MKKIKKKQQRAFYSSMVYFYPISVNPVECKFARNENNFDDKSTSTLALIVMSGHTIHLALNFQLEWIKLSDYSTEVIKIVLLFLWPYKKERRSWHG